MFKSSAPSRLALLLVSLVALFAVGCGDSRDEYVYTGNPPAPANTGNLTFQFQQQQVASQQAGIVPTGTTSLQFEFFSSTSGNSTDLVHEDTAAYANQVTITGVPSSAVFVRVTAYGATGIPLATFTGSFQVAIGGTTPVDLGTPTPITFDSLTVSPSTLALSLLEGGTDSAQLTLVGNFSNGQSVAFPIGNTTSNVEFTSSDENVATVSDRGLVEAVGNGNTTVTASYTLNGVEVSATTTVTVTGGIVAVDTLTVTPSTLTLPADSESAHLSATFTPAGGTPVNVDGNVTYSLQATVAGISVNNQTGVVFVSSGIADNTTAVVVATYSTGNETVTDTVDVRVGDVFVASVGTPGGNTLLFPTGTEIDPNFVVTLSNGFTEQAYFEPNINARPAYVVNLTSSSNPAVLNITETGTLEFVGTAGQSATFTVTEISSNVTATITATTTSDTSYTVDVVSSTTSARSGDILYVRVLLNYGNGIVQEITPFVEITWADINLAEALPISGQFLNTFEAYAPVGVTGRVEFSIFNLDDITLPVTPSAFTGSTVTVVGPTTSDDN